MNGLIQYYVNMVMLKATPQDCPVSQALQNTLIIAFVAISVIGALSTYNIWGSVFTSVLDLAVLYLFVQVLLTGKKERVHQTLNALLGSGIVIGIVIAICSHLFQVDPETETISEAGIFAFFLILIWIVAVYGNIIRHAVDTSLSVGMVISFGYVIVNMIVQITLAEALGIS